MRRYVWLVLGPLLLITIRVEAHKPITSKYTYSEDVFPIVEARCGRCHVKGGIAPMSLLTYQEAIPWAESIRLELSADHMPPWSVAGDPHRLSNRELDILLTWATGGTPEGPSKRHASSPPSHENNAEKPDVVLQLPAPFTLGPDTMEDSQDALLGKPAETDRWIRALHVMPGTAAVVREVMVYAKSGAQENPILWWFPGDDPAVAPSKDAYRWPAGAELRARIHYKKTWTYDGKTVTDRTSFAMYLLKQPPQHEVHNWSSRLAASALDQDVQVVAVRLDGGEADKRVNVVATRPNGSKVKLIDLVARPDWNRSYRLSRPIMLPRGTQIQTTGDPNVHVWLNVIGDPEK